MWGAASFMRHTVRDVPGWAACVAALEAARPTTARERVLRASRLADLLRFDPRQLARAIRMQRAALARAARLPERHAIRLRLAVALQYANRWPEALALMNRVARASRGQRDFLYQLRGKCLAEMDRLAEARADLARALALRRRRKRPDPELIASSRESLAAIDLRSR